MDERVLPSLLSVFSELPDPRDPRGVRHLLVDVVTLSILAVLCGANTFPAVHQYALAQEPWLRSFLHQTHGIPSQDTLERIFAVLAPHAWQSRFLAWTRELALPDLPEGEDEVLAIDGKTARRSHSSGLGALPTVSVWSSSYQLVLAQAPVDLKTNEITVIPELVETVTVAGAVVTTDALGTQKDIARKIREHHGDYVLALKDNHPTLAQDVQWLFSHADTSGWARVEHSVATTEHQAHGRFERRECLVLSDLSALDVSGWRDLRCVARVRSTRTVGGVTTTFDRHIITSLPCDAERVLRAVRDHWGIENGLHWSLDVVFDEDASRVRTGNAQASWVALRHLAVSLLKRDKTLKVGLEAKRLRAGWDRAYLLRLLHP